tara:strand:+ start:61 stop:1149 length:1089 start_codon:yes stop_codon:yes gene_type:complete
MATTYKNLGTNDIISTRTLLHEAIPITGTIVSGTYGAYGTEHNVKNYAHGMFQSVYDYPYLSSSANHIFDLTVGYSSESSLSASTSVQNSKKINIYNQMAQILMGHDSLGAIRRFQNHGVNSGSFMNECIFVPIARLLTKDELKKGSFTLELGLSGAFEASTFHKRITLKDNNAANDYRTNSPAGEYGLLYLESGSTSTTSAIIDTGEDTSAGLLFYQAGIAVLTGSIFSSTASGGFATGSVQFNSNGESFIDFMTGSSISGTVDGIRHRIFDFSFNNTTELNSTIYFCRANAADFNYSSNPTYLSSSKLVVKNESTDEPVSYITTVGLYSADNEMLATAKLSEPLKKTPSTEFTIRTRLDY